jgi:hypothetical protein
MATYKLPNETLVSDDMAFTWNDIQYPNNWIKLSTQADRDAIGLEGPLPEPQWYDQQFYVGYDDQGLLIPKDHAQLVAQYCDYCRLNANALLRETDWMVIREADNGAEVPPEVKSYRQLVREKCGIKVAAIEATADTDELAAYITSSEYSTWTAPAAPAEEEPAPAES